ncbi:MAG: rRNA maturation RNase YbeY [Bifidobacteriaceae bacterium]|jgi:probable rRNA maturation factor|nr:rRNA maturation RNase YbeY [Bifidobacteriaceae bacterium]
MSVEILNETDAEVSGAEFAALARFVMDSLNVHPEADLCITLVDATTMTQLHERWMGEPGPTDVLSFPMDEVRPGREGMDSEGILGDVIVCPQVAAVQAREAGHSAVEEMLLLTVHGILHLLGFDHAEKEDEKVMFALQRRLLLTFLASRTA